ncbi:MAG: low specificity L-threonine aldolase [Anaerovoracaceae bacterium]|jgi:threonine aldolase|nr:low specificity L-threonine aldolase [Anaerovoracaceae bacterium]
MIFFRSDYSGGAHPQILEALGTSNLEHTDGYGEEHFTQEAASLLKKRIGKEEVDVHFMVGGTQTNLTAISAFLRPHEAVVSAKTGHICVHETGAIEATGHKIIHLPSENGKVTPDQIDQCIIEHEDEHMVLPKLLYISNSTEIGTIYSKQELVALRKTLDQHHMYLYMDGARLGSALTCPANTDLTLEDLPYLCDAFYIGGTKNGFLFGEALVIVNPSLKENFRFIIKQKGGLLAKGRLLAIQFQVMFKNNLYFELAQHTNDLAQTLREGIKEKGYSFLVDSPTNQLFPIFPNALVEKLEADYFFYRWSPYDKENTVVRLVTSFTSTEDEIQKFLSDI